jgi:hypothetical protein
MAHDHLPPQQTATVRQSQSPPAEALAEPSQRSKRKTPPEHFSAPCVSAVHSDWTCTRSFTDAVQAIDEEGPR